MPMSSDVLTSRTRTIGHLPYEHSISTTSARGFWLTQATLAWIQRSTLLSQVGRPEQARRFLALTEERARARLTVADAAAAMTSSVRSLERWSIRWFGVTAGTVIDLARISSVAKDIVETTEPLKSIAAAHSFDSPSTMGRLFLRYSGMTPGRYRLCSTRGLVAEIAQESRRHEG
jgi:transcriptional regulator GlxA family with amidase domain